MFFYATYNMIEAISLSNKIVVLTKRPAKIKNIHHILFKDYLKATDKRRTDEFNNYYDLIWKEIDQNV